MYANLREIYDKTRLDIFSMAVTYLCDIGYRNVVDITDKEIDELEGNGLMTKSFVQTLVKLAREISGVIESPTELIQFCDAMGVFETEYYTNGEHMSRRTLEDISRKMANHLLYEDTPFSTDIDFETTSELADYLDITEEDLECLLEERG